jgi:hypothetical protein
MQCNVGPVPVQLQGCSLPHAYAGFIATDDLHHAAWETHGPTFGPSATVPSTGAALLQRQTTASQPNLERAATSTKNMLSVSGPGSHGNTLHKSAELNLQDVPFPAPNQGGDGAYCDRVREFGVARRERAPQAYPVVLQA